MVVGLPIEGRGSNVAGLAGDRLTCSLFCDGREPLIRTKISSFCWKTRGTNSFGLFYRRCWSECFHGNLKEDKRDRSRDTVSPGCFPNVLPPGNIKSTVLPEVEAVYYHSCPRYISSRRNSRT